MKTLSKLMLLFTFSLLISSCLTQKEKEENQKQVALMLKNDRFKFVAQQAVPLRMTPIQLSSEYTLSISKDSINCFLPYYGVATQAPYGSTDNGIQFISTQFSYNKKLKDNGVFEITIIPKNIDKATRLYLQVSPNGYASLSVSSNIRDAINFNGIIEKK
ncbi:DUF4251 domain-containing protein [Pelobium sp.]|nr:DUF4251 domain-containing protein [Pelobium sp.]MDA9555323.1 DUF4251 domain-containing protein [Pelobium sp.]